MHTKLIIFYYEKGVGFGAVKITVIDISPRSTLKLAQSFLNF